MAFCGVVAIVVAEACDGSSVCGDMHQKIVSILVSCVEPVWLCLFFFFEIQGQLQMKWRTYVPVLSLLGVFSTCAASPLCPRDLFRTRIQGSQGHEFKARVG